MSKKRELTEQEQKDLIFNFLCPQELNGLKNVTTKVNWDVLMSAVDRIEYIEMPDDGDMFTFEIINQSCKVWSDEDEVGIISIDRTYKFDAVYDAIIEFISWYNKRLDAISKEDDFVF